MKLFSILSALLTYLDIPTAPAYGTYISQLIRYSKACHNYDNCSSRRSMLAERLSNQSFSARKLMRTYYIFMGRYTELASKFNKSPSSVICDSVSNAQLYLTFPQLKLPGAVHKVGHAYSSEHLVARLTEVVVCACHGAYLVAHVFKHLALNLVSGRPA